MDPCAFSLINALWTLDLDKLKNLCCTSLKKKHSAVTARFEINAVSQLVLTGVSRSTLRSSLSCPASKTEDTAGIAKVVTAHFQSRGLLSAGYGFFSKMSMGDICVLC